MKKGSGRPHAPTLARTIFPKRGFMAHHTTFANETDSQLRAEIIRLRAEIDQLKAANDALFSAAHTDPLTGVLNRRGFARAARHGHIALVDMNDLKHINDTQGHHAGDEAIRAVAAGLIAQNPGSVIARFGGDEFAVNSRNALPEGRYMVNGHSVSCGAAALEDALDLDAALRHADARMYAHKMMRTDVQH